MWAVLAGGDAGHRDAGVVEVLGYLRVLGVISAGELGVQGCTGVCRSAGASSQGGQWGVGGARSPEQCHRR